MDRNHNKTKTIPIIFVTADTQDQTNVFKGYENGAVDFLRKPLDPHSVKSKVNVFLELYQQKKILKQQVDELKKTHEKLEHAIFAREEFMAIASHELRTPITVLKLQSQMRKRSISKGDALAFAPEKLLAMFEDDDRQLERLNRLIEDMLDASRISSGKLTIEHESFDMCSVVGEVVARNTEALTASGIEVMLEACLPINGRWDKFRIEQVITNLLTNVIRYGAGKPVEISMKEEKLQAFIVIKDHGIGIAKDDLKRIFQRFERVPGKEIRGLGLGLFIVTQIIEAHQGKIFVESTPGLGSTFTIELPTNL